MKLRLGETREMIDALRVLMNQPLPIKVSYWLKRALVDLMKEFAPFEESRVELIKKYAEKDEAGEWVEKEGQYVIPDREAFDEEYAELAEQEIEIKYEPLGIDRFEDAKISGVDLMKLGRLIKDDEEEPETDSSPLSIVPNEGEPE